MERDPKLMLFICAALWAAGCGDADSQLDPDGTGGTAGTGGTTGAGGVGGPGTPALDPLAAMPRYAVISSDYLTASSIAMLDEDFVTLDESWLSSGSTYPGLVAALSGDVTLPNKQAGNGTHTVIDRLLTDVVSSFYLPSGNLNGQVRTHGEAVNAGFSSNPHDVIFVDEDSAWVTRHESNLDPTAPPENQGNDLLEINPSDMSRTGARIDLSSLDTTGTVSGGPSPIEVDVYARPSRGVRVGSTLVVGLARLSAFIENQIASGPGMVAVVDLEDESIEGVELTGFENCGNVLRIPEEAKKVAVVCVGHSQTFGDAAQVRATAGIAILDVADGEVTIERTWRPSTDDDLENAVNAATMIDAQRVAGVAVGDFVTTTDRLYVTNLVSGEQATVHESMGSYTIGTSAYDPDNEMLFVPDAHEDAVIALAADGDGFIRVGATQIAPSIGLPPTQVHILD